MTSRENDFPGTGDDLPDPDVPGSEIEDKNVYNLFIFLIFFPFVMLCSLLSRYITVFVELPASVRVHCFFS